MKALGQLGVGARGYYRTPMHRQPALTRYAPAGLELPFTEELAATNLALPMSPTLSDQDVHAVVAAVAQAAQDLPSA